MADYTATPRSMSMLPGAIARPHIAGGSGSVGDLVYMASTGKVIVADGSGAGTTPAIGVVISAGSEGALTFVANDAVSVVTYGPTPGFSALTPGALGYLSDTAGKVADAAGTVSQVVGYNESATVFFVNPQF